MPILERLAAATGETATFSIPHEDGWPYLFCVEGASSVRMRVQPGEISPMDDSAIARTIRRYEAGALRDRAGEGVVLCSSGVPDPHTAALAAPVLGAGLRLIGAVAVVGPATRPTPERAQALREPLADAGITLTRPCSSVAAP